MKMFQVMVYVLTGGGAVYGYTKKGIETTLDTVSEMAEEINSLVEKTGGQFGAIPLENGGVVAGITWRF